MFGCSKVGINVCRAHEQVGEMHDVCGEVVGIDGVVSCNYEVVRTMCLRLKKSSSKVLGSKVPVLFGLWSSSASLGRARLGEGLSPCHPVAPRHVASARASPPPQHIA
jgi:hypothetical protein